MASYASDFRFLVATARRGIDDLRRALHRVRLEENERGSQFVAAAEALLAALDEGVAERQQEFLDAAESDDEIDQASLVRALRQITNDIRNVHLTTPWIEAAHASQLPLGLVYFIDEMATALLKGTPDVISVPSPQYMYSTLHRPFAPELEALQRDYPAGMPIIVHYPVQEVESLLLHLIVAHELGHSALRERDLIREIAERDAGEIDARLGEVLDQLIEIAQIDSQRATQELSKWFVSWLIEAVCDALALCYLGPSFLFSVTTFLTPFAGPRPSESHPPSNVRMTLLLSYMEKWGWQELLETRCPQILGWFRETADEPMDLLEQTYYESLGTLVVQLAPSIEAVVAEHLGDSAFTPAEFAEHQPEISALLEAGILPVQHRNGSAIERRSILLEGWLHMLERRGTEPDQLPEVVAQREFQAFLAKSLEMSAVLERWPETE